jgi:hypothetical protein
MILRRTEHAAILLGALPIVRRVSLAGAGLSGPAFSLHSLPAHGATVLGLNTT